MKADPLLKLLEDPAYLVQADRGELLEVLVEALFARLPGWKASRPSKTNAPDNGLDVEVRSPQGRYYVVQCKNLSTPADASLVRLTYAAKDLHRAHKAILICPSGFTKPALENAESLGVMTWGPNELKLLYQAASSDAALRKLGLWEAPKPPPWWKRLGETFANLFTTTRKQALYLFIATAIVLGFFVLLMQSSSPVGAKRPQTHSHPEAVVRGYDLAYRQALNTNDWAPLYEWAFASFLERKVLPFIRERQSRGCVLQTEELEPMRITSVQEHNDLAEVHVSKKWHQILVCRDKPPKEVLNQGFNTYYLLKWDTDKRLKVWYSDWN